MSTATLMFMYVVYISVDVIVVVVNIIVLFVVFYFPYGKDRKDYSDHNTAVINADAIKLIMMTFIITRMCCDFNMFIAPHSCVLYTQWVRKKNTLNDTCDKF